MLPSTNVLYNPYLSSVRYWK